MDGEWWWDGRLLSLLGFQFWVIGFQFQVFGYWFVVVCAPNQNLKQNMKLTTHNQKPKTKN